MKGKWLPCLALAFAAFATAAVAAAAATPSTVIASMDLSRPFDTRSKWSFIAYRGPQISDPIVGGSAPGRVLVCLRRGNSGPCDPSLQEDLRRSPADDLFFQPHYLNAARIVWPLGRGAAPLLLVQTASLRSGDGDQVVLTQALKYDRTSDRFMSAYRYVTGRNNNQDVRLIDAGPLKGDIISVEPTNTAPYGYWVTVDYLTPAYTYREILRYRSATIYGDGNPLAVIDSEMPNIEDRLGLWRPGSPLPLPPHQPCPKPRLHNMELWCN